MRVFLTSIFWRFFAIFGDFARFWEAKKFPKIDKKSKKSCSGRFCGALKIYDRFWSRFWSDFGGFWMDFGRFLGGFWEDFGRILGDKQ